MSVLTRVLCWMRKHRSKSGESLAVLMTQALPSAYRAKFPRAPEEVVFSRCANCLVVIDGMSPEQIVAMQVGLWSA